MIFCRGTSYPEVPFFVQFRVFRSLFLFTNKAGLERIWRVMKRTVFLTTKHPKAYERIFKVSCSIFRVISCYNGS